MNDFFLQYVFKNLLFKYQIKFKKTNKSNNKFLITDYYCVPESLQIKITNEILKKNPAITALNLNANNKVDDLNGLKKLKILYLGYDTKEKITNESIKNLNLKSLILRNENITDLSHMQNLIRLDISCTNISDKIFSKNTGLKILDASNNNNIHNIDDLTKLKKLRLRRNDQGLLIIKNTCITDLDLFDNTNVENIMELKNLKKLNLAFNKKIPDEQLKNKKNIVSLNLCCNKKIEKINFLTKLEVLNISGNSCLIGDKEIENLNLTRLIFLYNIKTTPTVLEKITTLKSYQMLPPKKGCSY